MVTSHDIGGEDRGGISGWCNRPYYLPSALVRLADQVRHLRMPSLVMPLAANTSDVTGSAVLALLTGWPLSLPLWLAQLPALLIDS